MKTWSLETQNITCSRSVCDEQKFPWCSSQRKRATSLISPFCTTFRPKNTTEWERMQQEKKNGHIQTYKCFQVKMQIVCGAFSISELMMFGWSLIFRNLAFFNAGVCAHSQSLTFMGDYYLIYWSCFKILQKDSMQIQYLKIQ